MPPAARSHLCRGIQQGLDMDLRTVPAGKVELHAKTAHQNGSGGGTNDVET